MKKKFSLMMAIVLLVLVSISLSSCSSDDSSSRTPSGPKIVKYEVTGNYRGQLYVVFTGADGQDAVEVIRTLPWSKEFEAPSSLTAVGFSGWTSVHGAVGQMATARIYVNNVQKEVGTGTADFSGGMRLPTLRINL